VPTSASKAIVVINFRLMGLSELGRPLHDS
jgi:hypothetical protein